MKQSVNHTTQGFDSNTRHKHFGDECKAIFVEKSEVLNLFNQDSRFGKAQFSPRYFASLKENAKSMLILIG